MLWQYRSSIRSISKHKDNKYSSLGRLQRVFPHTTSKERFTRGREGREVSTEEREVLLSVSLARYAEVLADSGTSED